uniref:Uncharacterized protein n=1 Tax=Knipowitschia caucasica TaxID=637954 RepID=A0AAV2JXY6_KNICA
MLTVSVEPDTELLPDHPAVRSEVRSEVRSVPYDRRRLGQYLRSGLEGSVVRFVLFLTDTDVTIVLLLSAVKNKCFKNLRGKASVCCSLQVCGPEDPCLLQGPAGERERPLLTAGKRREEEHDGP